jgi:RHS repeat-associated protein
VKPSADNTVYTFTVDNGAWKSQVQSYTGAVSAANLVSTSASTWDFSQSCTKAPCAGGAYRVRVLRTTTTLPTPSSNNVTSKTEMTYADANTSNLASIKEWKFCAGSSPTFPTTPDRETDFTYLATSAYVAKNILNRPLSITVKDGSGNQAALTNFSYDGGALTSVTGVAQHDDTNYGTGNTLRGNLTQTQRWVSSSVSISSTSAYDTTGQLRQVTDFNSNAASLSYSDNFFSDNGATPPATYAPAAPTNAYLTQVTLPVSGTLNFGYYFNTGKIAKAVDQNGNDSYNHFQDSLDRLTLALGPLLNSSRSWTLIQYIQQTQVDSYLGILDTTPSSGCASCRHDQLLRDNLGRTSKQILVSDPDGATTVTYTYDTSNRLASLSNPARSSPGPTDGTDTISLDGIDRTTTLTHPDSTVGHSYFGANVSSGGISAQLCSSSTYGLGYPVLSVDEAGMKLQKWIDGFGRLLEVDEPDSSGNLTIGTCYSYSVLNRVTQTVQGTETRSYSYDWLRRVTAATDPESGTTNLYYTNSSGSLCSGDPAAVCRRTDARNIATTYAYDAGNRLISKTYSDTTAAVRFGYDGNSLTGCTTAPPTLTITNPNGHQTTMCDGSGATTWSYDVVGHITTEKRIIQGVTQAISYAYNLDGSLASVTYPSNNVVSYSYSNAQRAISAIDTASGINYVQNVMYAPQGAISSGLYAKVSGGFAGITESYAFNSRLEPTAIKALNQTTAIMSLVPGFSLPAGNNGTVASVGNADGRDTGRNQTYTYDPLNRISTAQSQATSGADCWGQRYGYDRWANLLAMNITQCSGYPLSVSVDSHNHITNTGFSYDLSGNTTGDGLNSYSWDAENGLKSAAGVNYTYDGDRLRVAKSSGTLYWRSVAAQTLAETDSTGSTTNANYFEYVFFGGMRIARRETSGKILYYFSDQVGSTRVIFRSDNQSVCFDSDYTPFGTELPANGVTVTCPQNYKFTGYERDSESGLDYAVFRYYNPRLGRFMSPDPVLGIVGNPQSLNRYSFVLNNPCSLVDPFGLTTCTFNISINNEARAATFDACCFAGSRSRGRGEEDGE